MPFMRLRRLLPSSPLASVLGLLTCLAGAPIGAQAPPDATPTAAPGTTPAGTADNRSFTPTPHFVKGQVSRYQTQTTMALRFKTADSAKGDLNLTTAMDSVLRYKAQDTKADGDTVFSVIVESGKVLDVAGDSQEMAKEPETYPRTVTLDKSDRLLRMRDEGKRKTDAANPLETLSNQSSLLVPLHFIALPNHAVKIGDTWTARYPGPNAKLDGDKNGGEKDAPDPNAMRGEMTLLGVEKTGDQETLKIKQVLTVPFEVKVDAMGRSVTDAKNAAGRMLGQIVFTQIVSALPQDGQVLRSEGAIEGKVTFEGTAAKTLPSDTLLIGGKIVAARLPETDVKPIPAETKK